ncbi:hypothetical protein BGZ80_003773 [Entomortierella chlamydospora]|uniref:Uncharacterized protein n=1 Tax=Entomortierella chlamydospora TaxID=101097 RepID=A0A9P6MN97_9FUNG|nr:hypothetical protein BGZ80_003773 [Entomortierella chlamydospora]
MDEVPSLIMKEGNNQGSDNLQNVTKYARHMLLRNDITEQELKSVNVALSRIISSTMLEGEKFFGPIIQEFKSKISLHEYSLPVLDVEGQEQLVLQSRVKNGLREELAEERQPSEPWIASSSATVEEITAISTPIILTPQTSTLQPTSTATRSNPSFEGKNEDKSAKPKSQSQSQSISLHNSSLKEPSVNENDDIDPPNMMDDDDNIRHELPNSFYSGDYELANCEFKLPGASDIDSVELPRTKSGLKIFLGGETLELLFTFVDHLRQMLEGLQEEAEEKKELDVRRKHQHNFTSSNSPPQKERRISNNGFLSPTSPGKKLRK